ncbi:MAG: hypothetical protein R2734_07775 [Nocardioides sp.]
MLVTYDEFGGYGHPDHIQAHRVAMYAAQLAAVPSYRRDLGRPGEIAKIYWEPHSPAGSGRGCAPRGRQATRRRSRAWTQTGSCRRSRSRTPTPTCAVDANDHVEKKMAGPACPRHPDHCRRAVLRARTTWAASVWGLSSSGFGQGHARLHRP